MAAVIRFVVQFRLYDPSFETDHMKIERIATQYRKVDDADASWYQMDELVASAEAPLSGIREYVIINKGAVPSTGLFEGTMIDLRMHIEVRRDGAESNHVYVKEFLNKGLTMSETGILLDESYTEALPSLQDQIGMVSLIQILEPPTTLPEMFVHMDFKAETTVVNPGTLEVTLYNLASSDSETLVPFSTVTNTGSVLRKHPTLPGVAFDNGAHMQIQIGTYYDLILPRVQGTYRSSHQIGHISTSVVVVANKVSVGQLNWNSLFRWSPEASLVVSPDEALFGIHTTASTGYFGVHVNSAQDGFDETDGNPYDIDSLTGYFVVHATWTYDGANRENRTQLRIYSIDSELLWDSTERVYAYLSDQDISKPGIGGKSTIHPAGFLPPGSQTIHDYLQLGGYAVDAQSTNMVLMEVQFYKSKLSSEQETLMLEEARERWGTV